MIHACDIERFPIQFPRRFGPNLGKFGTKNGNAKKKQTVLKYAKNVKN